MNFAIDLREGRGRPEHQGCAANGREDCETNCAAYRATAQHRQIEVVGRAGSPQFNPGEPTSGGAKATEAQTACASAHNSSQERCCAGECFVSGFVGVSGG